MILCNLNTRVLQDITKLEIPQDSEANYTHICSFDECYNNSIYFIGRKALKHKLDCLMSKQSIIFVEDEIKIEHHSDDSILVFVQNVRKIMTEILIYIDSKFDQSLVNEKEYYFTEKNAKIHRTSIIEKNSILSANVYIGPYVYVGQNVIVGENTRILAGAKISRNTIIGNNCLIRENCVIGGNGFGIEKDENGNNIRIPHLGGVRIGDYVEIGALSTVCSGTIKPTCIGNYVKIDDHVHIGHNNIIEDNSIITSGAILGGSVHIGMNGWVGINSTVKESIIVGSGSLIGMATCVNKNIKNNATVFGNPSRELVDFVKIQRKLDSFLK